MILKPVVASYSGETYKEIMTVLNSRALEVVARVAKSPVKFTQIDTELLDNLVEMHVLTQSGDLIRLDTAVFLEDDIRALEPAVTDYSTGLSKLVAKAVSSMRRDRPEITNFIVGIIGIGQTHAHALREEGIAVDWKNYGGRYAQSKVDFNEICDAYAATGEDLQNKTIFKGTRYNAVFIGPGGTSYLVSTNDRHGTTVETEYIKTLNVFLTDAYATLFAGELDSSVLASCAAQVGLYRDGRPMTSVLTKRTIARYLPTIQRLRQITHDYTMERLDEIRSLLRSTGCGRQGVPVENLMLNFWRYIRKGVARQLYASGVFTDSIPETGQITVFFENDIEVLNALLD